MTDFDADIIIVGAGPSGLMVGCEAALGGAKVVILEKRDGPTWSRAGTLQPRVMEIFASRGIAERVIARAGELHDNPFSYRNIWAGLQPIHYAGLDSDYQYVLMFAQLETEKLLAEHFRSLGGDLRLRSECFDLTQDDDGVEVRYRSADGEELRIRGRYLVGADGNKSVVRTKADIAFLGEPARRIAVNVDAYAENPNPQPLTVSHSRAGWAMTYPLRDGLTRFAFIDAASCAQPRSKPIELDEAREMLRRVHGTDYGIERVDAINSFHDALFLAEKIRDRRIFLVGESVRVHYPASGVGMNFCLQDAFNLGWKLAAAATDRAPDWLLDSYVTERLPEINALLDDVRRQLAIQFNFDDEHVALKHFLERDVIPVPAVNLGICENLAGLSARYEGRGRSHAVVGRRLPNLGVSGRADAKSVFELLRRQYFVLLDLTGRVSLPQPRRGLRIEIAAADIAGRTALAGLASVLLRPDGHVAWAGDKSLDEHTPDAEIREWLNVKDDAALFEPAAGRRAVAPERAEVAH
jgi:2-polyprenyl-6-methoxyphenol hydroxylase-like FAD-dependent oxidoreductase